MKLKPVWVMKTLVLSNDDGGMVFATDEWPSQIAVDDFLLCMCGTPDSEGWFPYYELDHRWIAQCVAMVTNLALEHIGAYAIANNAGLDDESHSRSMVASASVAVQLFMAAFQASKVEARRLVRMNLSEVLV